MSQSFHITGVVQIADDGGFSLNGAVVGSTPAPQPTPTPVPPSPPSSSDAIDLASAIITFQSPDVRAWPAAAHLTSLSLSSTDSMTLDFSKRWGAGAWPIVNGPEGEIQYTLWVGCHIGGQWYLSAVIDCISRGENDNYVPTGPTLVPGQLPSNWYYFVEPPLKGYQPQPGESVAWFLTSGVQRRTDIHAIAERTQVVLAPFAPGTYTF